MSLDEFIVVVVDNGKIDWSCWTVKCKNRAEFHCVSRLVYCQLCKKCLDEDEWIRDVGGAEWEKGVDPILEENIRKIPFMD